MERKVSYEIEHDDYSQSANSLFHFMKKLEYLQEILRTRAIVPRYCEEDVDYLGITNNDVPYSKILVLQKCFCDIPLHKITQRFYLEGYGENFNLLTEAEKKRATENNTHPDFYGEYAIAFSKLWGERYNLQPLHYINTDSAYVRESADWIRYIMAADDIDDIFADEILNRLTFMKPLRGVMMRNFQRDVQNGSPDTVGKQKTENIEIEFNKNFYDEQEWRYVPDKRRLEACKARSVIANPRTVKSKDAINKGLTENRYKDLWLDYSYEEIRYIIVPDKVERNRIIETIVGLPDALFLEEADATLQKHIMISKILVLEEVKKDW